MAYIGELTGDELPEQLGSFANDAARRAWVPTARDLRRLFIVTDTATLWAYVAGTGWIEIDT